MGNHGSKLHFTLWIVLILFLKTFFNPFFFFQFIIFFFLVIKFSFKKKKIFVASVILILDASKATKYREDIQNYPFIYIYYLLSLMKYLVIRTLYKDVHFTKKFLSYNVSVFDLDHKCIDFHVFRSICQVYVSKHFSSSKARDQIEWREEV